MLIVPRFKANFLLNFVHANEATEDSYNKNKGILYYITGLNPGVISKLNESRTSGECGLEDCCWWL